MKMSHVVSKKGHGNKFSLTAKIEQKGGKKPAYWWAG
jgi:hypothetical protein